MGVFKLDLMTLLVVFVVLSVVVTMMAGNKGKEQPNIDQINPKTTINTINKVGTASYSTSDFSVAPAVIPQSRIASRTWN